MSALGQKQTCAVQNGMSALHPKADMCAATKDVRFVPIADIIITSAFDTIADESERPHSSAGRLGPICGARTGFAIP